VILVMASMETQAAIDNMRAPRKARAILNRLVGSRQLTESGLNWLIQVTDPNHDSEIRTAGYPDMTTTRTLTQCFTLTQNVSAPVSITGTNTFDCHVLFAPVTPPAQGIQQFPAVACSAATNVLVAPGSGASLVPGWNVITGINGMDIFSTGGTNMQTAGNLTMPVSVVSGEYRMVASSVEVVNTTPDLYKGGTLTAWRSPNLKPQVSYCYTNAATTTLPTTVMVGNTPCTNQGNAQLFPSARTWAAADGVYSIVSMTDIENPFIVAGVTPPPLFIQAPANSQIVANVNVPAWAWPNYAAGTGGVQLNNAGQLTCSVIPWNWQGAIFTGLNTNSTLQVTARYVFERCPSVSEPQFLVLYQPPADYDPLALEIYTRVVTELPVAVPVGDNPLGEWFNDVLEAVADYAPKIGQMFGPAGSFIGRGVSTGARMMLTERGANSGQIMGQKKTKKPKPRGPPPSYASVIAADKAKANRKKAKNAKRRAKKKAKAQGK